LRRSREEEQSRSGSDNLDGVSGDEQDADDKPPRKKRYHRHTPQQIQELERYFSFTIFVFFVFKVHFVDFNNHVLCYSLFKECPHPDEKQRLELSKRLCLETRQVKFWFQNRRTQMKVCDMTSKSHFPFHFHMVLLFTFLITFCVANFLFVQLY
jgi:homeobox-leucine zipper protein